MKKWLARGILLILAVFLAYCTFTVFSPAAFEGFKIIGLGVLVVGGLTLFLVFLAYLGQAMDWLIRTAKGD